MKSETRPTVIPPTETSRPETRREIRRNWANCFPRRKTKPSQADFIGVLTLDTVPSQKFWVGIWEKRDRNGETLLERRTSAKTGVIQGWTLCRSGFWTFLIPVRALATELTLGFSESVGSCTRTWMSEKYSLCSKKKPAVAAGP
jgi:hypothetical protein